MRRKWLIAGSEGVGKSSLANYIEGEERQLKNTPDFLYREKTIEVPSSFIDLPYLNNVVIMVGQNQAIVNVFIIDDKQNHFPPHFAKSFTRPSITIINKIDLYDENKLRNLRQVAKDIDSDKIFEISLKTGQGLDELEKYIKEIEKKYAFYNGR